MKLPNFFAIFLCKMPQIFLLLFVISCRSSVVDVNKNFSEKYGLEIEKLKSSRLEPKQVDLKAKLEFTAPVDQNLVRYTNTNITIPEYYSVQQFANQQISSGGFASPAEMFENYYSKTINSPFRKIGDEFDKIAIPSQDAYGIKANMAEKEYLLVSRKLLQKNVDQINSQRTAEDLENSQTLISEQGKLKRKLKMVKIFGSDSVAADDKISKN